MRCVWEAAAELESGHLSGPLAEIESKGIDSRLKLDALSHLEGFDLGGIELVEVVHSSRYVLTALR